ncbi:hypothetical protein ZWY2020_027763 [Hordeum vulgare]|nr:hypothetical protein ZWY2020_027763 [Hordeum vulgare]
MVRDSSLLQTLSPRATATSPLHLPQTPPDCHYAIRMTAASAWLKTAPPHKAKERIKELESQLLVERKITRHVDNKIAQDAEQKQ